MNRLPALLRSALAADPAADADLLARYRAAADGEAFAELVRRHGRLVWAACRHQTRTAADADDCFQAVWLALARKPAAVRDAAKLSAFLHAVAVRVCRKLRAANDRRTARERTTAVPDGRPVVPDSAWDRTLAAVHDEVAALPEPLRVAFVRCCLEGQGVTEAAAALGWKLGTLSGRLTRAKDRIVKRLDARGLTAGAVAATVCGGAVPAAVAAKAVCYATPAAVPASILILSQGVIVMNRVKLLAAGLLLAGGLGAGVGGRWVASAGAQDKPVTKAEPAAKAEPAKPVFFDPLGSVMSQKWTQIENFRRLGPPLPASDGFRELTHLGVNTGSRWDYYYVFPDITKLRVNADHFRDYIDHYEAAGWTFLGTVALDGTHVTPERPATTPALAFRRPATQEAVGTPYYRNGELYGTFQTTNELALRERLSRVEGLLAAAQPSASADKFNPAAPPLKLDPATTQKQRIEELEKQLAETKVNLAASKTPRVTKRIEAATLRVHPTEVIAAFGGALPLRFGAEWGQRVRIDVTENAMVLTGDAEAVNWTAGVVAAIGAK